jgi:outer membrane lipoprotein-sorting protein
MYDRTESDLPAKVIGCLLLLIFFSALVGGAFSPSSMAAEDDNAKAIVERADRIRFPEGGFQVNVKITTSASGREPEVRSYEILSKGNEKSLIRTLSPAAEKGQVLLMRDRDLWIYLPAVSQPVRLALSQRLTGQVANGDLARANFSGDYAPKVVRTDTIDGESYRVLDLKAVDRSVTYHRVLFWVNAENNRPYKAEFYSLSDRLLKTCRYENFKETSGATRPTTLTMIDALTEGNKSVLDYSNLQSKDLPDKFFTKDYLKKLQ